MAGKWEFPGGKVEPDETPRAALERELAEELRIGVVVGDEVTTTTHEYGFGVVTLTTYLCEQADGEIELTEHAAVRWLPAAELRALDWAPADIPAVERVAALLGVVLVGQGSNLAQQFDNFLGLGCGCEHPHHSTCVVVGPTGLEPMTSTV